jgi:hypothetical protein
MYKSEPKPKKNPMLKLYSTIALFKKYDNSKGKFFLYNFVLKSKF